MRFGNALSQFILHIHIKYTNKQSLRTKGVGTEVYGNGVPINVPSKLRARATFRPAHTAFAYWPMLSIGHECHCSRGRPMRARRNKIRGNIGSHTSPLKKSTEFNELEWIPVRNVVISPNVNLPVYLTLLLSARLF